MKQKKIFFIIPILIIIVILSGCTSPQPNALKTFNVTGKFWNVECNGYYLSDQGSQVVVVAMGNETLFFSIDDFAILSQYEGKNCTIYVVNNRVNHIVEG
jgi:hypothetical protein